MWFFSSVIFLKASRFLIANDGIDVEHRARYCFRVYGI